MAFSGKAHARNAATHCALLVWHLQFPQGLGARTDTKSHGSSESSKGVEVLD